MEYESFFITIAGHAGRRKSTLSKNFNQFNAVPSICYENFSRSENCGRVVLECFPTTGEGGGRTH